MLQFPSRFGSYVLVDHLGRGGMGTVFLAIRGFQELETVCVVKRLVPEFLGDPRHVERFQDEAGLARRFSHPNLVTTHDVGMVGRELYLAQEHVQGRDLSEVMVACWDRRVPIPVGLAVHIARDLALALAYVHGFENLRIVHRDINPPNIRISFAGAVKLLDFGVAKSDIRLAPTTENEALGKPFYMAPEQLFDEPVDHRADLYVLGLVLWELLTLRAVGTKKVGDQILPPREGRAEMLERVRLSRYLRPSALNESVPADLDAIVLKCLARDPADRFQSADELITALDPFALKEDAARALKTFMNRLFDVDADSSALKALVNAGRPLLQLRPTATAPSANETATGPVPYQDTARLDRRTAKSRRRLAIYGAAALCVAISTISVIEITNAWTKRRQAPQAKREDAPNVRAPLPAPIQNPVPAIEEPGALPPIPEAQPKAKELVASRPQLARQPSNADAVLEKAQLMFSQGSPLEALERLEAESKVADLFPARVLKAKIYLRLGRSEEAASELERALKMKPADPEALRLRALLRSSAD